MAFREDLYKVGEDNEMVKALETLIKDTATVQIGQLTKIKRLGEGGGCWNSGQHGTTDAYRSGFWYLDWLGTLAYNGRAGLFNITST